MDSGNIHRLRQRSLHWHIRTASRSVVIVRLPVTNTNWRAADGRIRSHSPFNSGSIDKRLEARACLPVSLNGVVEFVGIEIVAADHANDFTSLCIERHHCACLLY